MNQLIKNQIEKQLLSFDDDVTFNKSKSEQVKKNVENQVWIIENMVDLGLPSGTLWMKNNIGATCDETEESWYGEYYQWAGTQDITDISYDAGWNKCPYHIGYDKFLKWTKYNMNSKNILELCDDAAYKYNSLLSMPSLRQAEELISNTTIQRVTNYQGIENLNGAIFIGGNGNSIFIPNGGVRADHQFYNKGRYGYLWLNDLGENNHMAYGMLINNTASVAAVPSVRYYGKPIRGVMNQ